MKKMYLSFVFSFLFLLPVVAFGQSQNAVKDVKSENAEKWLEGNVANENDKIKKDVVITDAIINVNDEKQYFEQKKKEQDEKNKGDKKEVIVKPE